MCAGRSKIVMHIELYEGKEFMAKKDVNEWMRCATTSTCLRVTDSFKGSGHIVNADSWFGSVKSAVQLMAYESQWFVITISNACKNIWKHLHGKTELSRETRQMVFLFV